MTQANRVQRRRRRGQQGFTLIELLVVIAILGVLAGIVIYNVAGVSDHGSTAACKTDVNTVQAAVDTYRNATGATDGTPGSPPGNVATLVSGGYLHSTPSACASYSINGSTGNVTAVDKSGKAQP